VNKIENFHKIEFKNDLIKQAKIKEWEIFIGYYLKMKFHINNENKLLESYNINVVRDSKRDIESVARRVGLEI
jgi:hypothetical protein